jgi:hypothetical protein
MDWNKLKDAATRVAGRPILDIFDEARARDFSIRAGDLLFDYSKTNLDASTRDLLMGDVSRGRGAGPARGDVRGRKDQRDGGQGGPPHRAPQPRRRACHGGRPRRDAGRPRDARADGGFRGGAAVGSDRPGQGPLHRRRQHRNRRLGPRPRDGGAGAGALSRRAPRPLRVERRRRAHPRHAVRPRPRDHAGDRGVEDLHHHRDDDERRHRAALDRGGGGRGDGGPALRRPLLGARPHRRLRNRARGRLRLRGLGGRALLHVGPDRAFADDRHRGGGVPRVPEGRAGHGPPLPQRRPARESARHAGARRHLAQPGLRLRHPRGAALRTAPPAAPGLPPAARDGE